MRVAVVGNRDYPDLQKVRDLIADLPPDTEVVSGGGPGVDTVAVEEAKRRGLLYRVFDPDRDQPSFGLACQVRNRRIAEYADRVVAFSYRGGDSGTRQTTNRAKELGKHVEWR